LAAERLDDGSTEEQATFGIFSIRSGEVSLTEGFDYFLKGYRQGPLVWADVRTERNDPGLTQRRKLEALLGKDAEDVDEGRADHLIAEYDRLGEGALGEIAADRAQSRHTAQEPPSVETLENVAQENGYEASRNDMVRLRREYPLPKGAQLPAWRVGETAAKFVREQEKLGVAHLSSNRLAQLAGSEEQALTDLTSGFEIAFALDRAKGASRLALRSKVKKGRRFELARLVGDRLINPNDLPHPATRAHTYRQKGPARFRCGISVAIRSSRRYASGRFFV
jgi:hypothetical protein